ncbi:hypothetical protein AX16_001851 [Volvariella volvacea WC 439]|nr:hypothetical protein AX16_001851 [Volvariella volvacea WC 439]
MPAITRYISRGLEDLVPPTPTRGDDLKSEIQCYSLPFGVLGFISHILTYWIIAWLLVGWRPFWPKREVNYGMWSMLLSSAGLGGTISMAFKTIKSCKNTWQLLVIAVWKLFMSFLSGITAIHVAMVVLMQKDMEWDLKKASKRAAWWIALYVPGMVAGMTGLMSLVVQHWDNRGVYGLTIFFLHHYRDWSSNGFFPFARSVYGL